MIKTRDRKNPAPESTRITYSSHFRFYSRDELLS